MTSIDELIAAAEAAAEQDETDDSTDNGTCQDTDGAAVDVDGDGCNVYTNNPSYCGTAYDDSDFVANQMCCVCGGGSTGGTDETDDTTVDPTTCIDDATTPQACLD